MPTNYERYVYVYGIAVPRTLNLGGGVELQAASCEVSPRIIPSLAGDHTDPEFLTICLRRVHSQFRVEADDPKTVATLAYHCRWDAVILSAIFNCVATSGVESDVPADQISETSRVQVVSPHLFGPLYKNPYLLNEEEALWVENHFENARKLLANDQFQNALHALGSYWWHPHPRARLAVLWSGIEGLFSISSELSFRISLYTARFLEPNDESARRELFSNVKKLYKKRSDAVHGSNLGDEAIAAIEPSTILLMRLIKCSIEANQLPDVDNLAP